MLKRSICMLLVLAMMVSFVPLPAGAQENGTAAPNSEVTLEGDNSFGNLLANTVEESQNEGDSADFDARICDMTVEGTIATVEYTTPVAANLVVAIYTEDGTAMLGSGMAAVSPEETIAEVEIEIAQMPYYFSAGAFLLDGETNDPLSAEFKTDRYTKNMQDILSATVDDFNPELVLNLDGDPTTNFAVFNENTLLAKSEEGMNQVTDNEDGTYTITNADEQFQSMQEGDVFAYTYPDGNVLIVSAADVTVEGNTVTVTDDPDAELVDVFDFVKIETNSDGKEITYSDDPLEDGVYVVDTPSAYAVDVSGDVFSTSLTYGFEIPKKDSGDKDEEAGGAFSAKGTVTVGAKVELTLYISWKYQKVELISEFSVSGELGFEGKYEKPLPIKLKKFQVRFWGAVVVYVEPQLVFQFEGSLVWAPSIKGSIGFGYDSDYGWYDAGSPTKCELLKEELKGKVFLGIKAKVGLSCITEKLADLSLTGTVGAELSASKDLGAPSDSEYHECLFCIEPEVHAVMEMSAKFKLLNKSVFSGDTGVKLLDLKVKLFDFYISFTFGEVDFGKCPHRYHKTTITVLTEEKDPIQDANLRLYKNKQELTDVYLLTGDNQFTVGSIPKTNEEGKSVVYLADGKYSAHAEYKGTQEEKNFTVKESTKNVKLKLDTPTAPTPTAPDIPTVPDTPADACGDNLTWNLDAQGTLTISGKGDMYDFLGTQNGNHAPWFERRDEIISVIIHNGVTSIGTDAFLGSPNLKSVSIPNSVYGIGIGAFYQCSSLSNVTIPGGTKYIRSNAFAECSNLTDVTLKDGVLSIGTRAFGGCSSLTSITIPNSVTDIDGEAFYGCSSLTGVTIPDSVTYIGNGAFYGCSGLTRIIIPDSVTAIRASTFEGCSSLTSITIPNSVTDIDSAAFYGCSRLTSITIPDGVTALRASTFEGCSSLTSIIIPDNVTSIGWDAFSGCSSLTNINIPDSVTVLRSGTFEGCSSLTSITIPDSVTDIGSYAFHGCSSLTSLTIPDSVTSISGFAFGGCSSLTSVNIPYGVASIEDYAFDSCSNLTNVTISERVASIGDYAFRCCNRLTSITIPDSITSIGDGAFWGCSELKTVSYSGTMEQWGQITIGDYNEDLETAEIHCSDGTISPAVAALDANDSAMLEGMPSEPVAESIPEPTIEVPTEPVTEPTEPAAEPAISAAQPPAAEAAAEPAPDPTIPPETEPAAETEAALTANALSNIQWSILPEGAKMTNLLTARPLSAFTGTESRKGSLRSVKFTGLEPQEEYVLIVSLLPGSLAARDLMYIDQDNAASDGSLRFTYTPRENVNAIVQLYGIPADRKITLDREYLTMAQGDGPQKVSAVVTPQEWAGELRWSAENPEDTEVISVDQFGEVTPLNPGTAYAVATVTHGKYTFSARCRVDVMEEQPALEVLGVQLGADKVTTELFSTQYASFDAVLLLEQNMVSLFSLLPMEAPEDNGVAIESARFENGTMAKYFQLTVKDDRTLLVVPTEEAIQNPKSVAGSYTSKVIVTVCGTEHTADTALKLTVKKTMPKLKAKALTFNPFFTNQSQSISITGATVTSISRGEDTSKAKALPSWLTLDEGVLTLTDNAPKSGSGKVNLLIETEEWAIPLPLTLSAKLKYKAPGLKLSASSVTIPTFADYDDSGCLGGGVALRLLCKDKKQTLEGLGVSHVEAPQGWEVYNGDNGSFYLAAQPGIPVRSGKIALQVHFHGTDSVLELPLTIKAKQTPLKVRVSDHLNKNVKLNSMTEDGFFVPWWTAPQYLDLSEYELVWQILDKKGNTATDQFKTGLLKDIWGAEGDERLAVLTTETTQPGSYTLRLNLRNKETGATRTDEPTVIKFTVLSKTKKPGISVKAANAIDVSFPDPHTRLNVSFKNYFIGSIGDLDFTVTNSRKEEVTDWFELYYDYSVWSWILHPVTEVPSGSYVMRGKGSLRGDVAADFSTKITVKRTPIKLKLSKTRLTLNASIHDRATVDVTCNTKGYILGTPVLPEMDALDLSYSSGKLTVAANANTQYGVTYKIPIRVTEKDPAVTLSVKIPAQNKSTVSASLKAKGAIDPIRDGSSVVITPSYKNYAGETELTKTITIWSSRDSKNYTLDVTNQFQITENDDGTFAISKVPGAVLDTSLKYRAILSFPDTSSSAPAFATLPVKYGKVSVKTSGTPVLYKKDRFSRGNVSLIIADNTLNPLERVEFKDAKQAALYEVYYYGNGSLAIGFREGSVQNVKYPTSVSLNLFFTGNSTQKPNAAITVKIQIR